VARVSFEVARGAGLMITGANGSGKSTLLRCLATALRPHYGSAALDGHDLWKNRATVRSRVAFLSHASRLYEDLSAPDNLKTWARLGGYRPDIEAALRRVGLPDDRRDSVRTFSAGMRRRLALARVLIKEPDLVLLDEPFSALDPEGRALILDVGRSLMSAGAALIVATHMPRDALPICPQGLHLDGGQVVWRGPASETPALGVSGGQA